MPNLHERLKAQKRPSPFTVNNNLGGGFVPDGDRVALNSIKFASDDSTGDCCSVALQCLPSSRHALALLALMQGPVLWGATREWQSLLQVAMGHRRRAQTMWPCACGLHAQGLHGRDHR